MERWATTVGATRRAAQAEEVGHLFPNEVASVLDLLRARYVWLVSDETIQVHWQTPCSTTRVRQQEV
jgi:hypothetical protein